MHRPFNIESGAFFDHEEALVFCHLIIVTPAEHGILTRFCFNFNQASWNRITRLVALAPDALVKLGLTVR